MTKINLLPWREERRKELQRQFFSILGGVAVLSGLCVYVVYSFYDGQLTDQNIRNKYIEGKTAELESQITKIRELQARRDQIVDSMKVIQELQGNRPVIVYSMGELARTIPDGVYFTKVEKVGNLYKIYGVAESNNKISRLMRNLEDSQWFKEPTLVKVLGSKDNSGEDKKLNIFEMTVHQDIPKDETAEAADNR
jgi:type IV pilus assembly protein PilN